MKRKLYWFITNCAFAILVYLATVREIAGATNLVVFLCFYLAIVTPLCLTEPIQKKIIKKGRSVPAWLDFMYDICILGTLIWHSFTYCGIAYAIHLMFQEAAFSRPKTQQQKT